jgi:hypothetical protein
LFISGGSIVSYFYRHRLCHHGYYLLVSILFSLGLSACSSGGPVATPVISPTYAPPPTQTTPIDVAVATFTPTPSTAQVVLIALPGSDESKTAALQETLADLAAQDGLSFETVTDLGDLQFTPDTRLVAAVPPDPGIADLAETNPTIQFLAVGFPEVEVASNLSVIGADGERLDQQGFLAGYLAAVITQDWRVGTISQFDSPDGKAARNGFANGVIFFCGLCRPAYPPFIQYPVFVDLPSGGDLQTVVDTLVGNAVKTVYVAPGVGDNTLLEALAQAGIQIIGNSTPPEQVANQWVASISIDEMGSVRQIWPRLLAGEGGLNLSTPLFLSERNAALFSLGRQRLVDKMLTDLLAGYVDSGVEPKTGEMR